MKRLPAGACLIVGTLLGTVFPTSAPAVGTSTRYHLEVKTVDGELAQNGTYNCREVITAVGGAQDKFSFTVSVVNSEGKRDTTATGSVTAAVLPIAAGTACGLRSLNSSSTDVLYHATARMIRGVATFTALNAEAAGYYVVGFSDGSITSPEPPWVLLMVSSPNDPSAGAGIANPIVGGQDS